MKKGVYSDFLDLDAIIAAAEKTLENMEKDGWVEGRPLSQTKNAKLGKKGVENVTAKLKEYGFIFQEN